MNYRFDDFMLRGQILISNALKDQEILNAVSAYGYDTAKLSEGKALYDAVLDSMNQQKKDYGGQTEATNEAKQALKDADAVYMKTLKVARVALQNSVKAQTSMQIHGQRKKSLSGWIDQMEAFYGNLLLDQELLTEMAKFGYTDKKLSAEYDVMKSVVDKNLLQKQEKGKAQESTEQKDLKLKELTQWVADFRAIAKVALADSPQILEKLGITVPGKKAGRKPKNEPIVKVKESRAAAKKNAAASKSSPAAAVNPSPSPA